MTRIMKGYLAPDIWLGQWENDDNCYIFHEGMKHLNMEKFTEGFKLAVQCGFIESETNHNPTTLGKAYMKIQS